MSQAALPAGIVERVWDGAGDTWHWLRGVVLGEWEDRRSTSQIVADAMVGFVPGLGSIVTLRDLIAVIVRLARHPDKREDVDEWILLVVMLLPLILTAAGALAAGVGALVGAELGGFLRAVGLCLVKKGGVALKSLVEFLNAHGYGNAVQALRQVKFARYKDAVVRGLNEQIDKLIELARGLQRKLQALDPHSLPAWLPAREAALRGVQRCQVFIGQLQSLREAARRKIPEALLEMDERLGALLAGDVRAATHVTYTVPTGQAAPAVAKLERSAEHAGPELRNPHPPEPGNTRRLPERRLLLVQHPREYRYTDASGRPVGAKPYVPGVTKVENPGLEADDWLAQKIKVQEGWPDLTAPKPQQPGRHNTDYDTFSGTLRAQRISAGSAQTFKRLVSHDKDEVMDRGAFWTRALPADGQAMRADLSVKEGWNKDGQYVELRVPPKGHPVWKELHALQEKAAGGPVKYREELKFWEGPAASQVYKKQNEQGRWVDDDWYLPGGGQQQFFDREQLAVLQRHGFITQRQPTNFTDFDAKIGNIVPKDGPCFEVVPLDVAVPPPQPTGNAP